MKNIGVVSHNIYCDFTNYGSALQSWAMCQIIDKVGQGKYQSLLVDYCPNVLKNINPLNPFENMDDEDEETRRLCQLALPAIKESSKKFNRFFSNEFRKTQSKFTRENFADCAKEEKIDAFLCGSDTIFCTGEFGFDEGFFANYPPMKKNAVSYAASFGDPCFDDSTYPILKNYLNNFLSIGIRESQMLSWIHANVNVPAQRVIDPTLLLKPGDFESICTPERKIKEKYILLYARRYNAAMETYADKLADKLNCKVVEISPRVMNADKHIMVYDAGVEDFLSLVKHADYVVTNSYHGMLFSIQFQKPFAVFSRHLCDNKINELLSLLDLTNRFVTPEKSLQLTPIDYSIVNKKISKAREPSLAFLASELELFIGNKQ